MFLVSLMQQVVVYVVNYKGLPFMTPISKNRALIYSLAISGCAVFVAVTNMIPNVNKM